MAGIPYICPLPIRVQLLLGFVYVQYLQPAHVGSTVGTYPVGQGLVAALQTVDQMGDADGIVGATAVATPFAQFTLG